MRNRIQELFERKKENILSIYFTAGYPELDHTIEIIRCLKSSGVDMVEIGFPFSDPLADGPVIQQSSQIALKNGMSLQLLFEQLKELRKCTQMPVILMGYLNPVLQFGRKAFIKKCSEVGVDGLIIPDMPIPYYLEHFHSDCKANHISNILLITPETSEDRIRYIDQHSDAFLYMVSSNSITGTNKDLSAQTQYFERIKNMNLKNPTLTGFGIHNRDTFQTACKYSSGAIIGSAFIRHLAANGVSVDSIQGFIATLASR